MEQQSPAKQEDGSNSALAPNSVPPPPPIPKVKSETGARFGARDRMEELKNRERTNALYGDSPPPARQPAHYPDGEIIYRCNNRYVVRHGETITKYTTYGHGMGENDHPNEAMALRFIKANTTIPVPKVVSSDWDRITMEYVQGQTLEKAWPVLTSEERSNIIVELRGYIAQLHALPGIYIGRLDGQGVVLPSFFTRSGGPFGTLAELHEWLVWPPKRLRAGQSMHWHQITTQLGADYPIVFTHGDLAARNMLVRDGRIAAILDWEFAGWYPAYWDYVFALRGMDRIDWETLGSHAPSLFPKRYDLEYILLQFILSIS